MVLTRTLASAGKHAEIILKWKNRYGTMQRLLEKQLLDIKKAYGSQKPINKKLINFIKNQLSNVLWLFPYRQCNINRAESNKNKNNGSFSDRAIVGPRSLPPCLRRSVLPQNWEGFPHLCWVELISRFFKEGLEWGLVCVAQVYGSEMWLGFFVCYPLWFPFFVWCVIWMCLAKSFRFERISQQRCEYWLSFI